MKMKNFGLMNTLVTLSIPAFAEDRTVEKAAGIGAGAVGVVGAATAVVSAKRDLTAGRELLSHADREFRSLGNWQRVNESLRGSGALSKDLFMKEAGQMALENEAAGLQKAKGKYLLRRANIKSNFAMGLTAISTIPLGVAAYLQAQDLGIIESGNFKKKAAPAPAQGLVQDATSTDLSSVE